MVEPPERKQSRRKATQKAQLRFQEIRVAAEVRPTDVPQWAVGSVGDSLGHGTRSRKAHALQDDHVHES
jgi:hypothetical protein